MPNTLTPEQLQRLQQAIAQGQGGYNDSDGASYGLLNSSGVGAEGHGDPSLFGNGMYIGGNYTPGGQYNIYDGQGADTGRTGQYAQDTNMELLALKYMATLLGAGFGGAAMMGGSAAGAGAGAAAAGATETMPYMSLLEAPAAAGLEPYVMGAGAAGAGTAASGAASAPWEAGFEGTGALSGPGAIAGAGSVDPAAITMAGGSPTAAGGSSLWSSITGSGLLGPAASVIGGLLGSQPQEHSTTTQNQIDPRMVPYIYGDQGLLPQVQQQMQRSISPERQQLLQTQRDAGAGLLRQPVAGNGFSRMFPGR